MFQPQLTVKRSGIAGAIRRGEMRLIDRTKLILESPPLTPRQILSYSDEVAACLVTRELTRAGLDAGMIEVAIRLDGAVPEAEALHWLVRAEEKGESYLIGLTPLDRLLGIYPYKSVTDPALAPFARAYLSGPVTYNNPFVADPRAKIFDRPCWDLKSKTPAFYVLTAQMNGKRGLIETYLGFKPLDRETFALTYGAVAFAYDPYSAVMTQVNNMQFFMKFTPDELPGMIDRLPGSTYISANGRLLNRLNEVLWESWPLVISFLRKFLPPLLIYSAVFSGGNSSRS